jgi:hypothetical protein
VHVACGPPPRSASRPHEPPPHQDEQHTSDGDEREIVPQVIRDFPDVVDSEEVVVNEALDEIAPHTPGSVGP